MLNQIYIHYITTLFVLESFIISCWLLKGKKIGIGIGIGQFARKKSVSESATKNHDRASLIATSRPVPAAEKDPHIMMLPPPCFTVGTVLDRWWAVPGFLHTYRLELRPKSYILVSSDQRILFVTILESFRGFLANSMQAFMCLALRRGFRRATLS